MDTNEKVRENRLRRMAVRQGFRLVKIRRLDPYATDYGKYRLEAVAKTSGYKHPPSAAALTLDEVEKRLTAPRR